MNTRGKPFPKGNPGRPIGARHKTTITVERLLEGEADAIGRKCIEMALGGDTTALRLAMERIAPVRRARVQFSLPPVEAATTCRRRWLQCSRQWPRGRYHLGKALRCALAAM